MQRTFQRRITIGAVCGIILLLLAALYSFWVKEALVGAFCAVALVLIAEEAINTEYTLLDGKMEIKRGRLWRKKSISYSQIASVRPMTSVFGLVRYLLITLKDGRIHSVQPQNEQAFVVVLRKAMEKDRENNNEEK